MTQKLLAGQREKLCVSILFPGPDHRQCLSSGNLEFVKSSISFVVLQSRSDIVITFNSCCLLMNFSVLVVLTQGSSGTVFKGLQSLFINTDSLFIE